MIPRFSSSSPPDEGGGGDGKQGIECMVELGNV